MSEHDSDGGNGSESQGGGSGRKGFVRDVMRRINPSGQTGSASGRPEEGEFAQGGAQSRRRI